MEILYLVFGLLFLALYYVYGKQNHNNFSIKFTTNSPDNNISVIFGDVNGDENVSSFDAALTLQYSAGLISDWTDNQIIAGDVNGDENISSFDAALILQYSAGLIDEFPVEGE